MAEYLIYSFASLYALWVFYIAVMGLKRVKDAGQLSKVAALFGYPVFVVGYALDVFVNIFVMTTILLELPKELTVTARLKRHKDDPSWRGKVVDFFRPLLDPFDPSGKHI